MSEAVNRYMRGLETCPQAKVFKSERSATTLFSSLFSDAPERRVWLSAESKILAFTFEHFRLYRLSSISMLLSYSLSEFSIKLIEFFLNLFYKRLGEERIRGVFPTCFNRLFPVFILLYIVAQVLIVNLYRTFS